MKTLLKAALLSAGIMAVPAYAAESTATIYGGVADVDNGLKTQTFVGAKADKFVGDLGIHLDVATFDRGADAQFFSGGVSYPVTDGARVKAVVGTSTGDDGLTPDFYARGEIQSDFGNGATFTPSIEFRDFGAIEVTTPGFEFAQTFGGFVGKVGAHTSVLDGFKDGWGVKAGIETVADAGLTYGIEGEYGLQRYDTFFGAITGPLVDEKTWAVRPGVGYRLANGMQVKVRGEYSENDVYRVAGAALSFSMPM